MSAPWNRKRNVSLRGSSAKEITRDSLIESVAHQRELRCYLRQAATAALLIQKVWRRYTATRNISEHIKEEWEEFVGRHNNSMTAKQLSHDVLRPFIFFAAPMSSALRPKLQIIDVQYMVSCFKILSQSINSDDKQKNFCALALGTPEEKSTWLYQTRKLMSLCLLILSECDVTSSDYDIAPLTVMALRLTICLTDTKGWKFLNADSTRDADVAVVKLIGFMTTKQDNIYSCLRRYIMKCNPLSMPLNTAMASSENHILIITSAITLALRPFHYKKSGVDDADAFDVNDACRHYCTFIMTIPFLVQWLPPFLLPALKHVNVLLPCLGILLVSEDYVFVEISKLEEIEKHYLLAKGLHSFGWLLANVVNLAVQHNKDPRASDCFIQSLDYGLYSKAINSISEMFLKWLDNNLDLLKLDDNDTCSVPEFHSSDRDTNLIFSFLDLLMPVHQQWYLRELSSYKADASTGVPEYSAAIESSGHLGDCRIMNVVYFYYYMIRIFSLLSPFAGSRPVLNVLCFTPGFLTQLWSTLESFIFCGSNYTSSEFERKRQANLENGRDTGSKWANVIQKITGKTADYDNSAKDVSLSLGNDREDDFDIWDIEAMKQGVLGVSKDLLCMLHLFCAGYGHLLLVLDDVEFYEKQVLFTLQHQQRIAALLNTFVYNSFVHNAVTGNKPMLDVAIKCLHLLFERDCRHKFCPPSLWLAPARKSRMPTAIAAKSHEAAYSNQQMNVSTLPERSVLTTVPHVYPFEERVLMFREFIKRDKSSRRMAGELSRSGSASIAIDVRRDHIVDDGFRQLNALGSRLKSRINVTFISECGLPEAGLDYGGLSKEFLTVLSKAAFDPMYGLFSQSSASESSLVPNMAARFLENGIDMIEFLGRIVGKALYEGILLDYSFSLVFVQKLLGRYSFLDELSTLDPELYRNLLYLKHYEGDVADLSLDFTVTEDLCGKKVVIELKPGGRDIAVTNENKLHYVHAMADYKLNRQVFPFANAFYRGLVDLISPSWLSLFNANEFNQLLSGGKHDIDVDDLQSNTKYSGGYSETSRTVKLFWEVVRGFSANERCMLLKFVTSCSRAPLLGFKYLQPAFTIHKVACDVPLWSAFGGQDVDRLPSASTCYNTLKLPTYKRSSTLKNKLLYAISSNTGFELS